MTCHQHPVRNALRFPSKTLETRVRALRSHGVVSFEDNDKKSPCVKVLLLKAMVLRGNRAIAQSIRFLGLLVTWKLHVSSSHRATPARDCDPIRPFLHSAAKLVQSP